MNQNERRTLIFIAVLLLLGGLGWKSCSRPRTAVAPGPELVTPPAAEPAAGTPAPVALPTPVVAPAKPAKPIVKAPVSTSTNGQPEAPKLNLRKDLIPKDITIVRCYYQQEVVPPNTSMGFDINGSGFTKEFEQMISVDAGLKGLKVKNLHLVTANQIHGEMEIGADASTSFVYPRVLIKGQPVFSAPEPFAVIRKSEVLTIFFISMEDNGRAGRFRVLTNLDDALYSQFRVIPSTPELTLDQFAFRAPYVVEGTLHIGPRLPPGEYGLHVQIGEKVVHRRDGMIRIVKPNVGSSGFIQGLMTTDPFYRPGDAIQFYMQGSGFIPDNVHDMRGEVSGFDMGVASFTFLNTTQMRVTFNSPSTAPSGSYGVKIVNKEGAPLYEKKDAFQLVPSNWIRGVQVTPPVKAGAKSTLKIIGRDMDAGFVKSLKIDLDEDGIAITGLTWTNPTTLTAEIAVAPSVRPGDYWLQLSANGRKISPPFGSIIKVETP